MTIFRGPGGTGSASSDSDTTEFQEFLVQSQAARDAAQAAQAAAEAAEAAAEAAAGNVDAGVAASAASATAAAGSASSAATSATNASSSASSASTSATNAASSASSASTSASSASTSATNAGNSATAAASSATDASASASAAASSASTATTQASNAAGSASSASTSATAAQTAETNAEAAQTAAESARDATLAAYDSFDDRYLGAKAVDPTLDNDGNPLLAGELYFNTVSSSMKVYTGAFWVDSYTDGSTLLAKAANLSDLANVTTARTNLGVAIGTDVQAYDADLTTWSGKTAPTGVVVGTSDTQTLTNKTLTAPNIDSAPFATVSGTAPLYTCRAWVNFNGTGTVAIRASGNVSSISDLAVGSFAVNMATALPDVNYSATVSLSSAFGVASTSGAQLNTSSVGTQVSPTTTAMTFTCLNIAGSANVDPNFVNVAIFR